MSRSKMKKLPKPWVPIIPQTRVVYYNTACTENPSILVNLTKNIESLLKNEDETINASVVYRAVQEHYKYLIKKLDTTSAYELLYSTQSKSRREGIKPDTSIEGMFDTIQIAYGECLQRELWDPAIQLLGLTGVYPDEKRNWRIKSAKHSIENVFNRGKEEEHYSRYYIDIIKALLFEKKPE